MKLIPEARRFWRMLSMQFGALALVWLSMSEARQMQVLSLLPLDLTADQIAGLLIVLGMFGRLIAQPKVRR
jgi:hypothetical protein